MKSTVSTIMVYVAWAGALILPIQSHCAPLVAQGINYEEQILEISSIRGTILSDPILVLSKGKSVFLPLLDLGKVLGIFIEQPNDGTFKVFSTDTDFQILELKGCPKSNANVFCAGTFERRGNYYVESSLIRDQLSWPITIDLKSMQITVNIDSKIHEHFVKERDSTKPVVVTRYNIGPPAVRIEAAVSPSNRNTNFNLYETQPLLDHDSDFLFSKTDSDATTRWTLSKEIVEPDSPFQPRNYEFMSTQTLDTKYLFAPTPVVGFRVSNISLNDSIFDTQNFYERGPPRWKVELYVNEVYMGETFIDVDGRFSFLNVPIFYGQNKIRYHLTSPLGRTSDIERIYTVGAEFEGAGKLKYQAAYGQKEKGNSTIGSGIVNYGISSNLSAQLGFAEFDMITQPLRKQYSLSGISFLQSWYSITGTHILSVNNRERAWALSPKLNVGGNFFLTGEYARFEHFRSQLINSFGSSGLAAVDEDRAKEERADEQVAFKKVSALTSFRLRDSVPVMAQLTFFENNFLATNSNQQAQVRLYSFFSNSSLLLESSKFWPSTSNPELYAEVGKYSADVRGKAGVLIQDDKYSRAKFEFETLLKQDYFLTLGIEAPVRLSEGSFSVTASKLLGEIQTGVSLLYSSLETIFSINLATNMKFGRGGARLSQDENYRQANVDLFAFVDENANGTFDEGERPYPRLRVLHVQRQREFETDSEGHSLITGIDPYQKLGLEIVRESIANIFLTARDFQNDYVLTPGQQLRIDIPVVPSFDLRGTIHNFYFKKLLPVEIVDDSGRVVASVTSSAAGRYKLSDLPGGHYFVQVYPQFLSDNGLVSVPARVEVLLTGKAGVRSAPEMAVRRR